MFITHLSHVSLKREEPDNFKVDSSTVKILERNEELAVRIVMSAWLKGDLKKVDGFVKSKIKKKNEFEERSNIAFHFMEDWNKWRKFYFNLLPIKIKTKSQLTQIENAIEIANNNKIKITFFIACTHKAFIWRNVNPGFHNLVNDGLNNHEKYIDEVMVDIDKAERDLKSYG